MASYSRCPQQKKLVDQHKADAGGKQPEQLSMTAYGSVMHHAIHVLEKLNFDKRPDAVEKAHATFDYYWDPANITAICDSVTIWAARQTWAGLGRKGHQTIDLYAKYLQADVSKLLGLELEFNLPFELDGEQHIFHGTMDRLCLRKLSGTPYLNIEDFKTGKDYGTRKGDLRWNAQFSGYCIDGETPVLMGDGEWKPIRDVSVGDRVMGFDEYASSSRRRWGSASVLHKWTTEKEGLRLTFDDGRQVVCSGDHRWLSRSNSALWQRLRKAGGDAWVEAGALRVGDELAAVFAPQVIKHDSHDYMRGYVAGACLGDGSFDPTRIRRARSSRVESLAPYWSIQVAEEDVAIIDRLEGYFDALGIVGARRIRREPNLNPSSSFAGTKPMVGLRTDRLVNCERLGVLMEEVDSDEYRAGWLAGLYDTDGSLNKHSGMLAFYQKDWEVLSRVQSYAEALGFRFKFEAGHCDHVRLSGDRLQRYRFSLGIRPALDRKTERLDGRTVRIFEPVRVVSIESMGVRQLFDITTSTATFVANGILSHNCWATTQQKFWTDAWGQEEGAELFTRFSVLSRRATWISLKNGVDRQDAGWRGPQDYARFWAAIREYVKAVKADIYPLSLTGDVCFFCAFREGVCGGVAVPDEDHGRPEPRPVKA